MHARCPHCHQPVELVEKVGLEQIDCPLCGHAFRLSCNVTAGSEHELEGGQAITHPAQAETIGRPGESASILYAVDGRAFGEYVLAEEIARGGMGVVFKARQTRLNRTVAVKMILAGQLADPEDVRRFLSEAEAAAGLDHPGIVPVYECGQIDGQHFFSMGLVEGQSLATLLAAGPLPPRRAAELVAQVSDAVNYAHEHGVIHRDLKPGNILLDQDGHPRVTDFGLAKRVAGDSGLTRTGQALGTPSYMPPEQASGKIDAIGRPADVYALGAVLYAALTGRPPFQAATPLDTILQVLEQEPVAPRQLNADVPRDLETIALKCLQKEPPKRYATASELADELRRFLRGEPIHARPVRRIERAWRWCRRNPIVAGLTAAVVAALMAGTVISSYFAAEANDRAAAESLAKQDAVTQKQAADKNARRASDAAQLAIQNAAKAAKRESEARASEARAKTSEAIAKRAQETLAEEVGRTRAALREADVQRSEAQRQLRIANVLRIASQSQAVRAEDPTQAILLALEALRLGDECDTTSRASARQALRESLNSISGVPLVEHEGKVFASAISPDGHWLATAGFEKARLWDLTAHEPTAASRVLRGSEGPFVVFSPSGRWLATKGGEATVRLLDLAQEDPLRGSMSLRGQGSFGTATPTISANGRWLASGSADGTIRVWDLAASDMTKESHVLRGHQREIISLAITRDGHWLASSSRDKTARVWDLHAVEPSQHSRVLEGTDEAKAVAITSDGHWLAMGGAKPRLWDLTSPAPTANPLVLRDSREPKLIWSLLAISPDDHWLVTGGSSDNAARLWDLTTKNPAAHCLPLRGHEGLVVGLAISGDSRLLATGSRDKTVRLWNLIAAQPAAEPIVLRGHEGAVHDLAISSDGHWLATSCGPLGGPRDTLARLWDLSAPDGGPDRVLLRGHQSEVLAAAISPDGRWLATGSGDNTARLWDLTAPNPTATSRVFSGHDDEVVAVAFSPDGQRLITASLDNTARLWDLTADDPARRCLSLTGHTAPLGRLAVSFDGRWLATGSLDNTVRLWNLSADDPHVTSIVLPHPPGPISFISYLAFSPDNRWLATCCGDCKARLWDLTAADTSASPQVLTAERGGALLLAFSPDGQALATSGPDTRTEMQHTVRLWDLKTAGPRPSSTVVGRLAPVWPLVISNNGRWLAAGSVDKTARLWDLATDKRARNGLVLRHESAVRSLVVSADGCWLATGSADGIVRVWDLTEPEAAASAVILRAATRPLAITPDGRRLVTGSPDGTVCLSWLNPADLVRIARATAGRELTDSERRQFLVPAPGDASRAD